MPRRTRISASRRRRPLLWIAFVALYAIVLCVMAVGPARGWRDAISMVLALDPNAFARTLYLLRNNPQFVVLGLLRDAIVYLPIGLALGLGLASSRRTAVLAAMVAFDTAAVVQIIRWLRPLEAPSLATLFTAIAASLCGCWVGGRIAARIWPTEPPPAPWRRRRIAAIIAGHLVAISAGAAGIGAWTIGALAETPSQLATLLHQHAAGHGPALDDTTNALATGLVAINHMALRPNLPQPDFVGAIPALYDNEPSGPVHIADTLPALADLIARAVPGDVIELAPGTYRIDHTLWIDRPGTRDKPIILRAARLGDVSIDSRTVEAFKVFAPHWIFENLVIRGRCPDDSQCEHAFHVVDGATSDVFRNLRLLDFNAQIKINRERGGEPDRGVIDHVTFLDTHPRHTGVPVAPIDLDAASGWRITANFIADFVKTGGNQVTYGGYAKGAGSHNVFARNVVVCAWHLRGLSGARVGLSLGGGGTSLPLRRDKGRSGYEQSDSVLRDNLIVNCNDDGVYLNRAFASVVAHNTLLGTAGIDVRFPESLATITANIVDGPIRARDGGSFTRSGNLATPLMSVFLGEHPIRRLFVNPDALDLRWRGTPPAPGPTSRNAGLCGHPALSYPGAFENFTACLTAPAVAILPPG